MKHSFLLLIALGWCYCGLSQPPVYKLLKTIRAKAEYFTTDQLGNVYLVKGSKINKLDLSNEKQSIYSNKLMGNISSVDASDPMKVILFYKELSQLIILDNMMSTSGEPIHLETLNLEQVILPAGSNNNQLWFFDPVNYQLINLNSDLKLINQTGDLRQILDMDINPTQLLEYNNQLYLNCPENGILVFDIFGTYYKTIPITGINHFQVHNNNLYYSIGKQFYNFDMTLLEKKQIRLPEANFKQIRIEEKMLYLLGNDELKIYALP